ncbi:hypothetical protein D3C72_2279670 [compost metagenome]
MVHQGTVLGMGENRHVNHPGIHHAGHDKVDQPVPGSEGHRSKRTLVSQFLQVIQLIYKIDDA